MGHPPPGACPRYHKPPGPVRPPVDIAFALKAVVGTASPVLGVATSFQEQIEWHLRILSLLVGLAIGVLLLIGLWRKVRGRR
jgi:hypothetical protein